jgi:Zn-dependent protease with chaperone function
MALEKIFEAQLKSMNPAAVEVFQQATTAMDAGDYGNAEVLFRKVITMAPEFSTAYRRLSYIELYNKQNVDRGIELLRYAMQIDPNGYNQTQLALALVFVKGNPSDYQEAYTLASSATVSLPTDDQAYLALLLSAAAVNNIDVVRQADERLLELSPGNPLAHYFAGLLAADAGHWEKAESELLYSQRLGMDASSVQEAMKTGISRNVFIIRFLRAGGIALGGWLLGLGILYGAGTLLSKATLRSLEKMEPTIGAQLQPAERTIRSIYRAVIVVLSIYFYISIPFIILALFIVVGGIFYLFFMLGRFPIQLIIFLVIMFFASLYAILKTLFFRRKEIILGRELRRDEAPELWNLVENVARKMNTRPVDSILVTPFANIAVNEKGGGKKRNLLLGMGVLCNLNQGQLAAILAHEYGHFYNRDTAGGDLVFKVYSKLNLLAISLVRSIVNPAWLFVMAYQRIFLSVSQGASRLQEILADRFAVMAYGRANFIEGLKNIVKQSLAFEIQANFEVSKMFELNRPISNLYQLTMQSELQGELDSRYDVIMKAKTAKYDSHPSTNDRIALIERMRIPYALDQENGTPVADLFPNLEELQQNLTSQLIQNVRRR